MDINNYASKGVAGTALGLGAGALGIELVRGGLGNLFGGCNNGWNNGMGNGCNNGWNAVPVCSENMPVNRYELDQLKELINKDKELINKDMEIAYLKGRDAAKTDSLEMYKYFDGRFRGVEAQISNQAVVNSCMQNSIETLMGLTKTVIPIGNVCPAPMPQYNSWTAPTTPAAGG